MKEGHEYKAALQTNRGLFEPLILLEGLMNGPVVFQAMMDDIFQDKISEGILVVYIDNIWILDNDVEWLHMEMREVLQRLHQHGITCKPEKCKFEQT